MRDALLNTGDTGVYSFWSQHRWEVKTYPWEESKNTRLCKAPCG